MIRTRLFSLLIITLGLCNRSAQAEWTGVSVEIGESTSDLQFETGIRTMRKDVVSFQIEEKTATNLRVGLSLGITNIRISNKLPPDNAQKFEGGYFGFYLRLPVQLGEHFSLESLYSYQYHSAANSNDSLTSDLEWHNNRLQIGLGAQFQSLRITPFIAYRNVSGDISDDTGTELFDTVDNISRGISFDVFIEPGAYIRFQLFDGDEEGGYLTFAREY